MVQDLFNRLSFLIDEVERIDKESTVPEGESDPALQPLFDEASAIVRQLNPLIRERYRNEPERLAAWESILNDDPELLAEDEEETAKAEAEAAKEAEGLKLAADMQAALDCIDADVDRLAAMEQTDLEFEALAQRVMTAIHELDIEMRLRGRAFPEQLERWKDEMKHFADIEAIFDRGRELEDSRPVN